VTKNPIVPIFGKVCEEIHHPITDVTILIIVPLAGNEFCLVDDGLIEVGEAKDVGQSSRIGDTCRAELHILGCRSIVGRMSDHQLREHVFVSLPQKT